MHVRILGAHQGESRDMRYMSILIDGRLAIDAGGLTTSLTLEEQLGIEAILITHQHFDHIKDLPMLAHNLWDTKDINIYCTDPTREMLQKHIFNDEIWPKMDHDTPAGFKVLYHRVVPDSRFDLIGYHLTAVPMVHTVPTVGYLVEHSGKSVFYTADTRSDDEPSWVNIRPDLLIVETTMSNSADEDAYRFKHLTPVALRRELVAFHGKHGYYPRTVCVHINPRHEQQVHKELNALAKELGARITPAHEGMEIEV